MRKSRVVVVVEDHVPISVESEMDITGVEDATTGLGDDWKVGFLWLTIAGDGGMERQVVHPLAACDRR